MQFAIVFFATWVMSRIENRSVFDYGLARSARRTLWLVTGAFWAECFGSPCSSASSLHGHLVITGVLLGPLQGIRYGVEWAVMFLGVAFFEESLFRGYLQFTLARCLAGAVRWMAPSNRYARPIGFWTAAMVISFGFGLGHGSNPGESPDWSALRRPRRPHVHLQPVAYRVAVVGYRRTRRVGLVAVVPLWRARQRQHQPGPSALNSPGGSPLMSGGLTGPEGSLFVLPVMLCINLSSCSRCPSGLHPLTPRPGLRQKTFFQQR